MNSESYDFIIAGGGTAALVVAARLSEDSSQRILVLEAGSDHSEDPRVKTPALYSALLKSEVDWDFQTETQVHRYLLQHAGFEAKLDSSQDSITDEST